LVKNGVEEIVDIHLNENEKSCLLKAPTAVRCMNDARILE
jgi:hypothetical protein